MSVNKYRIKLPVNDLNLNIPISLDFNTVGKEDLINVYEEEVIEKVINPIRGFEIARFSHEKWNRLENEDEYSVNYKFFFYDREIPITDTTISNINNFVCSYNFTEVPSYTAQTFTDLEASQYSAPFRKSFFKLDLYDSKDTETQKSFITIIIPTQQGIVDEVDIGNEIISNIVDVKRPNFILDYVGDKEGYFIYWLKERDFLDITEFYMSAKFFNAKTGQFVRMLNRPQSEIPNKFNFSKTDYHYYKVILNYENYTYTIYNNSNNRVGNTNPINWFEYINP